MKHFLRYRSVKNAQQSFGVGRRYPLLRKGGLPDSRPVALGGVETCLCSLSRLPCLMRFRPALVTICEKLDPGTWLPAVWGGPVRTPRSPASAQTPGPHVPPSPGSALLTLQRTGYLWSQDAVGRGQLSRCSPATTLPVVSVLPAGPGSPASSLGLKPSRPGGVFPRAALPLRAGPGVSRLDDGASLGSLGAGGEGRQSPG